MKFNYVRSKNAYIQRKKRLTNDVFKLLHLQTLLYAYANIMYKTPKSKKTYYWPPIKADQHT